MTFSQKLSPRLDQSIFAPSRLCDFALIPHSNKPAETVKPANRRGNRVTFSSGRRTG